MPDIQNQRTNIEGQVAEGSAPAGNPVLVAGDDGANVQNLAVNTAGRIVLSHTQANDDPMVASPLAVCGRADTTTPVAVGDGDSVYLFLTTEGALVAAGHDGTNPQLLNVDATGRVYVRVAQGQVADGGSLSGVNPVTVAGSDGTNAQFINVDAAGRQRAIGAIDHDSPDLATTSPIKCGMRAINHGTNPTAVAADDMTHWYANRHGVPWVIGGHPNIVSREFVATTARTDTAIVTVGAGTKIVVTEIEALVDNACSVDVGVRIGFGTANVPTLPADGASATQMVLSHPGIAAGSGVVRGSASGILAIGADNADLRITSEVPTGGSLRVMVSYYTIQA